MNRMSRLRRNRWDIPEGDVHEGQRKTGIRVVLSMSDQVEGIQIEGEGTTISNQGLSDKSRSRELSIMFHRGGDPLSRMLGSILV